MKKSTLELKNRVAHAAPLLTEQTDVFSTALAVYIANYVLELPTTALDDPDDYFTVQCMMKARGCVNTINEQVIVNIPLTLELSKTFWLIRYRVLFPTLSTDIEGNFFDRLYKTQVLLNDNTKDLINRNTTGILELLPAIDAVHKDKAD